MTLGLALLLLAAIQGLAVVAISPISVKGTKLYDDEGDQFFIKGVVYQPDGVSTVSDPLADTNQCQLDAGFMKDAGVNTVRVYTVDASLNHDGCMQAFATQGIYAWIGLTEPLHALDRADPEWTEELFTHMTKIVDTFAPYNNTLALEVSNELINDNKTSGVAPYVKAAARDMKAFRNARGYRKIPMAYSAADVVVMQQATADYLACGDEADSIDMYGLNAYSWCGNSSYSEAGYDKLYERLQPLNIPAVFTEVGCNIIQPRTFDEVSVILGSVFPNAFSGAIVYEWAQEENDYGLVEYPSSSTGGFPDPLPDYTNLQKVFSTAKPVNTPRADYTPSNTPPACPTTDDNWTVDGDATLPTIAGLNIKTVSARTTYIDAAAAETTGAETTATTGTSAGVVANSTSSSDESGGGAPSNDNQGLSTGAIAGIAIGGALVGILAIVAGLFIFRRRKAHVPQEKMGRHRPRTRPTIPTI
ncbi:1,3-beta-glucanosyltransferase gas2 [Cyphellophora attinorum]|uniref:1,3-beta-glucanosyltransferase n=1 Tax=Cyphellophora attinorum TaxID=1664694 RepID=A0A0N0NKM5_9EURO|nr:1,3-beta-glucanosyltransferase gas2 [Phialophora attinorum]KPI38321.1 1,3-beta-glucanosyltransferase gas2 [Phialophora attinorum]